MTPIWALAGRTARGAGGRDGRRGDRIWNRGRLLYVRVHPLPWLDGTTAFIQFIAETLVSIRGRVSRGRVSILRASLGGARQILLWNCLIATAITRRQLRPGSSSASYSEQSRENKWQSSFHHAISLPQAAPIGRTRGASQLRS